MRKGMIQTVDRTPQDLVFLDRLSAKMEPSDLEAKSRLEEAYREVLERDGAEGREYRLSPAPRWADRDLEKALRLIAAIVTEYVRVFYDPHSIPVTHYKKQKALAIHLDEQFKPLLREAVVRAGVDRLEEEDGAPARDVFLDEPILFLKQEARAKGFPKDKKLGGISTTALRERFQSKLQAKGVKFSAGGDVTPKSRSKSFFDSLK